MSKRALVTGITGQDGSYLAELLLRKGYEVYGLVRRLSTPNYERIAHILDDITIVQGDLLDQSSLDRIVLDVQPMEVYNLAAMSHVGTSFEQPTATGEYNALGVMRLLEALRNFGVCSPRFYQASTSELFGGIQQGPYNERTPFYPRSPYGCAKLYAHWATQNYRESYGMFACSGILFNHESPRRGVDFVTRKITNGIARIKYGLQDKICLGNLNAERDWGYAGDYVEAMWLMLQQDKPEDFVIATGEKHTVREFVELAFTYADIPHWSKYVDIDPALYRPAEVNVLVGDATKAHHVLGWQPRMSFGELVATMVESDLRRVSNENQSAAHYYSDYHRHRSHSSLQTIQRVG